MAKLYWQFAPSIGHYLFETNQSREQISLCGRKGVGLYFHKSHSINAFSIIIQHWLHKFGWLISCLCWGYCSSTHRLWTCPAPCTSGGGRTGTGFCSLCPPRSSSAGDTGNLSHSTETAGRNPGNYLMWNRILIRLIILPTLHPSHVMTP